MTNPIASTSTAASTSVYSSASTRRGHFPISLSSGAIAPQQQQQLHHQQQQQQQHQLKQPIVSRRYSAEPLLNVSYNKDCEEQLRRKTLFATHRNSNGGSGVNQRNFCAYLRNCSSPRTPQPPKKLSSTLSRLFPTAAEIIEGGRMTMFDGAGNVSPQTGSASEMNCHQTTTNGAGLIYMPGMRGTFLRKKKEKNFACFQMFQFGWKVFVCTSTRCFSSKWLTLKWWPSTRRVSSTCK